MNSKLIHVEIVNPIDRIRGADEIAISVTCTFETGSGQRKMAGVATCNRADELDGTVLKAIENAKDNFSKFETDVLCGNQNLSKVVREMLVPSVDLKRRKITSKEELDKMYEIVGEDKQQKIIGLCEALGIDIIDTLTWTNIEVIVLINYLERMTEPLSRGNDG